MAEPVPTPVEWEEDPEFLVELDTRHTSQKTGFYVIFAFTLFLVVTIIMCFLTITHRRKVYTDLSGDDQARRILFAHRTKKNRPLPERTVMYSRINLFIFYSMLLFTCSSISGTLSHFAQNDYACGVFITLIISFVVAAKSMMYLVFLMKLQRLYGPSPYGYPTTCFIFFYFAILLYGICVIISAFWVIEGVVYHWEGATFPNLCQPANLTQYPQFAVAVVAEDIAVTIGFIWAYKIPLIKTYDAFKDIKPNIARKVLYMGYKMVVLTGTATVTSLIAHAVAALTQIGAASTTAPIISALCLMFMTGYYVDERYYRRYCKFCIVCCHSHNYSNFQMDLDHVIADDTSYRSADTGSQLRAAGAKLEVQLKEQLKRIEVIAQLEPQELEEINAERKEPEEPVEEEVDGNDVSQHTEIITN